LLKRNGDVGFAKSKDWWLLFLLLCDGNSRVVEGRETKDKEK
jgi:hypothetical protein